MHWNFRVAFVPRGETANTTDEIRTVEAELSKPPHKKEHFTGQEAESPMEEVFEAAVDAGMDKYALENHWDLYCGEARLKGLDWNSVRDTVTPDKNPSISILDEPDADYLPAIECESRAQAETLESELHEEYGEALLTHIYSPDGEHTAPHYVAGEVFDHRLRIIGRRQVVGQADSILDYAVLSDRFDFDPPKTPCPHYPEVTPRFPHEEV